MRNWFIRPWYSRFEGVGLVTVGIILGNGFSVRTLLLGMGVMITVGLVVEIVTKKTKGEDHGL